MTEAQVGFLYNIAAAVSCSQNETTNTLLKSYYLMRCKNITRGYGLPEKQFSSFKRCPKCCIEWRSNTKVDVRSIKLSKRQRKRLKSRKVKENKKDFVRNRNKLLHSNEVAQLCSFCNKTNVTAFPKPTKPVLKHTITTAGHNNKVAEREATTTASSVKDPPKSIVKPEVKKKEINVYANSLDVFSIQNKNNELKTKEKPKVINNNKRKKDKFAGLCQKAVLASAKIKERKDKQNKINLFLKPSL
ncbi:uncharacterized protein LOC113495302 [Trichoplusia ni]|uniref:Uncharacterized protein LOC113495302 n=1 Tax=Trichoplusia ni TaxID=7111 RepID=A0A7E5VN66_TRINI|nr:uncharacterized protein LOC113495302 [Trichoplusia ni]